MADVVTRIGHGMYRVESDGVSTIVYVAGSSGDRWAFWEGHVFRATPKAGNPGPGTRLGTAAREAGAPRRTRQRIEAPMPAIVTKVLVGVGSLVKKGEALVLLEAMKMELPLRSERDAVVTAVHCLEGARVEAGAVLVDLE